MREANRQTKSKDPVHANTVTGDAASLPTSLGAPSCDPNHNPL